MIIYKWAEFGNTCIASNNLFKKLLPVARLNRTIDSFTDEEIKIHKAKVKAAEKKGLIVLIKPDDKSKYKNLVDILDEMLITNVATINTMVMVN